MWVQSLGQEKPLEKEIASHSSCLKNPMDRGARRLWFIGSINSWTQLSTPHSPGIYVYTHTNTHTNIYTHTHICIHVCVYIYTSFVFVVQSLRCVQFFATPWTAACQAPLSMEFPRQAFWSGLPFPSSGDLPNPGIYQYPSSKVKVKVAQSRPTLCDRPWNSPGQNTGVGSHSLLQQIFPTQGSNPGLPHCRHTLYQPSHQGNPRILEWVATPFSRGSSWPRN